MKKLTKAAEERLRQQGATITRKPAELAAPTVLPPAVVVEPPTPHWVPALLAALSNLPAPAVTVAAPVVRVASKPAVVYTEMEIHSITRERFQDRREISGAKVKISHILTT